MLILDTIGANHWDSINQELKALREEVVNEVEVNFKDIANLIGGMHHRLRILKRRSRSYPKPGPTPQRPRQVQTMTSPSSAPLL
jgi:hypothetical protein